MNHTIRIRQQWQDDTDDKLTTLPFHEYEKQVELRTPYAEMFQTVEREEILRDLAEVNAELKWRSEEGCCSVCFVTSHDVQRGHVWVAVPEGCGDEDCDCHIPECGKCRMLGDLAPCDECYSNGMPYEPNLNGFISTVSGKEIATVGLVVLMFVSIWFAV